MKRLFIIVLCVLAILCGLSGLAYYLTHYVDSVRVEYKRWKAPSRYTYDDIHPIFKETDPKKLIRISSNATEEERRRILAEIIWGTPAPPTMQQPSATSVVLSPLPALTSEVRTTRIEIPIDHGYRAVVYWLRPQNETKRVLLYQHGYAGTFEQSALLLQAALNSGHSIALFNYPGYGENQFPRTFFPKFGWYAPTWDRILTLAERPIRFYVEPISVFINYAETVGTGFSFDLAGFSAGGWVAALAGAVDTRIERIFSVAGGYPLYLRSGNEENQSAPPQYYGPLLHAANHLEMYVLAASGGERRFTQIFNRYDRCCFRNRLGKLYEPAVQEAVAKTGQGSFRVLIDETHADHKVSDWAVAQILTGLQEGR